MAEEDVMKPVIDKQGKTVSETKPTGNGSVPSVLDIFREAREAIPEEEMDKLPVDGAAQVDHYVYGLPKR